MESNQRQADEHLKKIAESKKTIRNQPAKKSKSLNE